MGPRRERVSLNTGRHVLHGSMRPDHLVSCASRLLSFGFCSSSEENIICFGVRNTVVPQLRRSRDV